MLRSTRLFSRSRNLSEKVYAITCPGQGIIKSGLLAPFSQYRCHFDDILQSTDEALKENFSKHLFNEDEEFAKQWLSRTSNAQPAILITTYILHTILKKEFNVDLMRNPNVKYVMGHSLGEYTALCLSDAIDLETSVKLVRRRGTLMEDLIKEKPNPYEMMAVLFKPSSFSQLLKLLAEENILANINSYQQLVISGHRSKLVEVVERINSLEKKKIILKTVKLPVTIPFHSDVLGEIEPELMEFAPKSNKPLFKPIISNLTGEPVYDSSSAFTNTILANSRPVQWVASMEKCISTDITNFINVGPGTVLQDINSKFKVQNNSMDSLKSMEEISKLI
ncbi:hypothetical protein CAAN1_18S01926 [[Candida] anglica]|uniref:[acyl-carrier-protein] S-malonyltransferase n=1 Tax=[Candida] anglica TaxID=148631 RepID=A0ABP0ENP5_9ASCO